jgi:ankyrin repeat protein
MRMLNRHILGGLALAMGLSAVGYAAGTPPLVEAAQNKDKAAFKTLLAQKADVKAFTPDGTTALHWAAHWNDLEMVNALLAAGADPKVANRYGVTPLAEAAASSSGGAAVVERLLKAGADANTLTTPEGETVLMTASRVGNVDAVKVLLDHGANPNAKESYKGQTALMWAAAEGHPDVIKLLLAKGADPKILSDDRDTTLPKLPAGSPVAPVSRGGLSALSFAARQGQIEAADALIAGGSDINQKDVDGNTPLVLAILNKHYDLAQTLINKGADVNAANKDGRTPLYTAVEIRNEDWSPRPALKTDDKLTAMDTIKSLLDKGANVNARLTGTVELHKFAQDGGDKSMAAGATAFMRAARSADVETMRLLLAKGADPKLANKDGLTALLTAAGVSWAEKIRGDEKDALEAVKMCVDLGLDVNAATDRGETALHGAALRGANSIVSYLVEKGAKLDVKNKQGFTPLDIANGKGGFGGALRDPRPATVALIKELLSKSSGPSAQAAEPKAEAK